MSMVFCRGCGKEIHESAISCPQCGAQQGVNIKSESNERSAAKLILIGAGWTLIIWLSSLFLIGIIYGVLFPEETRAGGAAILGEQLSIPCLLLSVVISSIFVWLRKLPGSK